MKRSLWPTLSLGFTWMLLALAGCGDSLVGLECRAGYVRCGGECVEPSSDALHCGGCGMRCAAGEMCSAGSCTELIESDAGGPDGGGLDGGPDGGDLDAGDARSSDAQGGEGGSGEGGFPDVVLPPLCTGPDSPSDCVCELGELVCELSCKNANIDLENCGACGHNCNAVPPVSGRYFCIAGVCELDCDAPLSVCGSACLDLQIDPENCGTCGNRCESGLCDVGQCLDRAAGHVIVIGHDMSSALPAAKRLAGNAIFLPAKQMVRGLVFDESATASAKAGVQSAINEMSAITGRTFLSTTATSAALVPFLLSQADVFVIVAQANASDEVLIENGDAWSRALQTFVGRGGVIALFDGGGDNTGTYQLLQGAGLFSAASRTSLTPRTVDIEAPGDAIASFVPSRYQALNQTVGFDTTEQTVVVRDRSSGLPVVVHIAR